MKAGDKVWVWNAWGPVDKQIQEGELVELHLGDSLVRLEDRERPYAFLACELFETREELCEHYRKIFE